MVPKADCAKGPKAAVLNERELLTIPAILEL